MTDHSNDAPVNSERRWLGAALLGALGTSVLSGCANQLGESEPQLGTATAEVTANVVAYNDLRALVPSPGGDEVVAVQGRVDRADGGEGLFVWADQDVSSDNDGTILKPTSKAASSPGRWRRVFSGAVNVRWFGAVSDTEAESGSVAMDSTAAVVAAIKASAPYGRTYFPRGVYWVDADALTAANYVLHGGARLIGENHSSAPLSVIKARTPGICLLEATVRLMVESLTIDCAGAVDQGIRLLTAHSSSLRHVVVKNAKKNGIFSGNASPPPPQGWTSGESAGLHFEKVVVTTCGEAGIKLLGASDSMLLGCIVTWNGGPGLEIHGSASTVEQVRQSGGIIWIGGEVSLNGFTGYKTPPTPGTMNFPQIVIRGVEWARLESIYMEAGEQPAVRIQDSSRGVTLTGLRVGGAGTANRAFHLLGVQACTVFDCHAQGGDYYPAVRIEDAGSSIAHGNTVINGATLTPGVYFPLAVERVTAEGTWTGHSVEGALMSAEPPTVGRWKEGQFVRNSVPSDDYVYVEEKPLGWVCQHGTDNLWGAIYPKKAPCPPDYSTNPLNANLTDTLLSTGGYWYWIGGGYDGKRLTIINTHATLNMTLRHMDPGSPSSNVHLTGRVHAAVPPGGSITLARVTIDTASTQSWGDSVPTATRWREIGRSF